MDKPFPAYEGEAPYFFVSYAHEDAERVYPEMSWIRDAGFELWYDDGIHVGTVWRRALADSLSRAAGLIYFATERSVVSSNCLREINFALDEDKPLFVLQLDDAPLPAELRLSLSDRQSLRRSQFDEPAYRARLTAALSAVVEPRSREAAAPLPEEEPPRATRLPAVALLPLTTRAGDDDLAFWAEGVAEELARLLSQRYFRVVTVRAADVGASPRELGERLGVSYVFSASVRRSGERVRVTGKLEESSSGNQLWGRRFDETFDDELGLQDELSESMAIALSEAMMEHEIALSRGRSTESLDAWSLVVRSAGMIIEDRESRNEKFSLLRRAVALDPDLAAAHAELAAWLTVNIVTLFSSDPEAEGAEALRHADEALKLAPNSATVLNCCSFAHRVLGDEALALQIAERATAIAGTSSLYGPRYVTGGLYPCLLQSGRAAEVIARGSNDRVPDCRILAWACLMEGRYEDALEWGRKGVAATPDLYLAWVELANELARLDRLDEAKEALQRAKTFVPTFTLDLYEKGCRLAWRGNEDIVAALVEGLRKLDTD
jgi:TolB-like protein